MAARRVIIIGAGIGGLSTGCYARMNGYDARILEMHSAPGGVCTAWRRRGYVFDGSIHNLAGTGEASPYQTLWRELGVIPAVRMHGYSEMVALDRPDGPPFVLYSDLDRLEAHARALFPADAPELSRLLSAARDFGEADLMALALAPPLRRIKALGVLAKHATIAGLTLERYAQRFHDPFLRRAFPGLVYDWPQQSMLMLLSFLGGIARGDLGWPVGGSEAVARAMEKRFTDLGGAMDYGARVETILVENDRAVGVRLTDGTEARADIVISNAYGPATIFDMLGGRYVSPAIRAHYARPLDRSEMGLHVSLGVARDLSDEPHAIVLPLDAPVEIAGEMRTRLYVQSFGHDPGMAPPGKGVLKVLLGTDWSRWDALAHSPTEYKAFKARIADTVIAQLARRFPGIESQIEATDVATPLTTRRITGNGVGYPFTIRDMSRGLLFGRRLSQTLPGLGNFYMVGQWAGMPGVPMVAAMGRDVVRELCRRDGRRFSTFEASPGDPGLEETHHAA
jgi:phytoene dehydrogenase-like protein